MLGLNLLYNIIRLSCADPLKQARDFLQMSWIEEGDLIHLVRKDRMGRDFFM